jgi:hypothetical protein
MGDWPVMKRERILTTFSIFVYEAAARTGSPPRHRRHPAAALGVRRPMV